MAHAMTILGRIIEGRVKKSVNIDNMQFRFVAERSMTDAMAFKDGLDNCINYVWVSSR